MRRMKPVVRIALGMVLVIAGLASAIALHALSGGDLGTLIILMAAMFPLETYAIGAYLIFKGMEGDE